MHYKVNTLKANINMCGLAIPYTNYVVFCRHSYKLALIVSRSLGTSLLIYNTRMKLLLALQEEVLHLILFTLHYPNKFVTNILCGKKEKSEMLTFVRNWTQGLWLEPPFFWPLDRWTTSSFCIPFYMLHTKWIISLASVFCVFSAMAKKLQCVLCIFMFYCSWYTIPK